MFKTPILLLIYNRPETTYEVFNAIRKLEPDTLYIAADGPNLSKPEDEELCNRCRGITSLIDWNCKVHTLFRDENLGCGKAVSEAITWFFDNVEMGIILEDDCLPDLSFFTFCEILLDKYKDEEKISTIGAYNYQLKNNTDKSYYYSIYSHIWGWATWRRTWKLYDLFISDYDSKQIEDKFSDKNEFNYWNNIYKNIFINKAIYTWDYQLQYINFKHNKLSVIPSLSLVKNIGFYNGTHILKNIPDYHFKIRLGSIDNIIHPTEISRDIIADKYFFENMLFEKPKFTLKKAIKKIFKII